MTAKDQYVLTDSAVTNGHATNADDRVQHLFNGAYSNNDIIGAYKGPNMGGGQHIIDLPDIFQKGGFDKGVQIPKDFGQFPNFGDFTKPTDKEEHKAEGKLDKQIGGLVSPEDKQNLKDINHAILTGDDKALAGLLAKYKDDPEKLKAVVDETNRELKDSHAGVGLHMSEEGKVYAYRENGQRAVEMDPQTGQVTGVRKIMVGKDGEVYVGDADKNANPDKVMEHIADRAVSQINDPFADYTKEFNRDLKDTYSKQQTNQDYKHETNHKKNPAWTLATVGDDPADAPIKELNM